MTRVSPLGQARRRALLGAALASLSLLPSAAQDADRARDGAGLALGRAELEFLAGLRRRSGNLPPAGDYGGAVQAPRPEPAPVQKLDPRRLLESLPLSLRDSPDSGEVGALEETVLSMLASPTASAEMSALSDLLARPERGAGRRVRVSFQPMEPSAVIARPDGSDFLLGPWAKTNKDQAGWNVDLNKLWLGIPLRKNDLPSALAHELLGHVLNSLRADEAYLLPVYELYEHNETAANLMGWLVRAELRAPLDDPEMWGYLKDPKAYKEDLMLRSPDYADALSLAEMSAPTAAYGSRLAMLDGKLRELEKREPDGQYAQEAELRRRQAVAAHFTAVHGIPASRFRTLNKICDDAISEVLPQRRRALREVIEYLNESVKSLAKNDWLLSRLQAAPKHAFFQATERLVEERTRKLRELVAGREPDASFLAFPKDQINFEQLRKLRAGDKCPGAPPL